MPYVSSAGDATVTITLRNPKNLKLVTPTASADAKKVIRFSGLSTQPEYGKEKDYTLTQTANNKLTLTYKKDFLQAHEWGNGDIGSEITFIADDNRVFDKRFSMNFKVNTPPPKPTFTVAKTTGTLSYYVLCLRVPDMDKTVSGGLLHKDIKRIDINGTSYSFSVNETQTAFIQPESDDFIAYSDSKLEKLNEPNADTIPKGGWVLYYKTDVQVQDGAAKRNYTIKLIDAEGLVSGELTATTKPNKPAPVQISLVKGISTADVNSDNTKAAPHTIRIDEEHKPATLRLTCATADSTVYYTLTETTAGSSASPLTASGAGSGVDIPLPIQTGRTEAEYTLTVRAEADGFETGTERTLYYKITTQSTVTDPPVLTGLSFSSGGTSVQFSNAADTGNEAFSTNTLEYYIFAAQLSPSSLSFTATPEPDAAVTVKVNGTDHTGTTVPLPTVGGETLVTFTVEKAGLQNEYKVHIKRKSYTVTLTAKSSDDESAAGGGTINVTTGAGVGSVNNNTSAEVTVKAEIGATITATAMAASGCTFIQWSKDGTQISTTPSLSYVVGSNAEIKAEFKSPNIYVRGTNGEWYDSISGAAEGDDTTGTGSKQKPYKTVSKALSQCTATGTAYTIFVDGTIEENATLDIASGKKVTIESLRKDTPAVIHDNRPNPSSPPPPPSPPPRYLVTTAGTLTLDSVILKANITATHGANSSQYVYGIQQTDGEVTVKGEKTEIKNFAHAVKITGGTFTMESGSICDNHVNASSAAGVVIDGGAFVLKGGSIKGNESTNGAGVYVKGATFTMNNGEISGNKAKCLGGGIYVDEHGIANISGGTIKANHAAQIVYAGPYGLKDVGGGGICILEGTVNFTGGTIEGNIIHEVEKNCGAGVFIGEQGTFNMSGGTIKDCTTETEVSKPSRGIGVYVAGATSDKKGTFNMTGGTIENCKPRSGHTADGGGVYVGAGAVFTMKKYARVTPSTGSEANGKGKNDIYLATGAKITINEKLESSAVARITPGSYPTSATPDIRVLQNPTGNTTNVAENYFKFTVTRDANANKAYCVNEAGLIRQQVDTTPYDTNRQNWAKLKAAINNANNNDVIYVSDVCYANSATDTITVDNKTITLIGVTSEHVSLNASDQKCRIFTIKNGGNLTIKNMELKGHAKDGKGGGGILLENDGNPTSLTLENVSITSCYTSGSGTRHGAGIAIYNGTVTMKGKTQIWGCESLAAGCWGGGVYIGSGGILKIDGDNTTNEFDKTYIRYCKADKGGGVYIASGGKLELKQGQLSGNRININPKEGVAVYNENISPNSFNWTGGTIESHYTGTSGGSVIKGPCNNTSGNTAN